MAKILKIFYFEIMNHNVNINHTNTQDQCSFLGSKNLGKDGIYYISLSMLIFSFLSPCIKPLCWHFIHSHKHNRLLRLSFGPSFFFFPLYPLWNDFCSFHWPQLPCTWSSFPNVNVWLRLLLAPLLYILLPS